jgi:hypothetical protein
MKKILFTLLIVLINSSLKAQNIPMTFHNGSYKSIALIIPGVMNPNLNPKSYSGVSLDVGQNVYFFLDKKKKKKEILFTVDNSFQKDTILEIDQLIEKRRIELEKH